MLLKFFLNSNTTAYLRSLESEFGDSTNSIRLELNRFEEAGMLTSFFSGNKKMFQANKSHPLFREVHTMLLKTIGLDKIILDVIERLGEVEKVLLVGEFAKGLDSPIIDLIFVGEIDKGFLVKLVERAEEVVKRKIRYLIYSVPEFEATTKFKLKDQTFLLWSKD